jgi:hypothetical protein
MFANLLLIQILKAGRSPCVKRSRCFVPGAVASARAWFDREAALE